LLLHSDLYHLPLATTTDRVSQLGAGRDTCLSSTAVVLFPCTPFEMHASRTGLGLAIRRAVTDLTPNFALPPVPDSPPSHDGAAGL